MIFKYIKKLLFRLHQYLLLLKLAVKLRDFLFQLLNVMLIYENPIKNFVYNIRL